MGNNTDRNNNSQLVRLDMDNATNEQKLDWLCRIIDNELEKPEDEINNDLILECYNCIDELTPENEKHTPEELAANLERIKAKAAEKDSGDAVAARKPKNADTRKPRKRVAVRVVAVIAAALLLMFATLSVAAVANGYSNAFEYVSAKVSELLRMKPGDSKDDNGITIVRNGKTKSYKDIEELLKAENLDILYPSVLPDGESIKKLSVVPEDDLNYTIAYQLTSNAIKINVSSHYINKLELLTNYNIVESNNGNIFYVFQQDDRKYQAICQYEGFEYIILTDDYSQMILIIENIKETEK